VKRSLLLVALLAGLLPLVASAQRVPDTLAKIKAAKSITVAFSADSLRLFDRSLQTRHRGAGSRNRRP
jgi:hypothetical protein